MIPAGKKWRQTRPKRGRQKASARSQDASKAPPTCARKVGDSVVWETAPRTYTAKEMDQILSAYGATLSDASKAPLTYARAVDGKPVFEVGAIA
jgi:hypothetical protein